MRALTAKRGIPKRCLPAALAGVHDATGANLRRLVAIVGCRRDVAARAQSRGALNPEFQRARRAAERAASYACWRPEARESIASGLEPDKLAKDPSPTRPKAARLARPEARKPPAKPAPDRAFAKPRPPVELEIPPAKVAGAGLSDEDVYHLKTIAAANGGRGFPAPKASA